MTGALAGLRVVEIAGDIAGPYCTKLLADLGADVTKIEPPAGDALRRWGPFPGGAEDSDKSGMFEYLNAGKSGATIDLGADVSALRSLVGQADLLVDGMPPGALDELGLGVAELESLRPGLVVVRISPFGQHGPMRDRQVTPLTVQAASGWVNLRDPERPPVQAGARIAEHVAGGYAALGALTALRTISADTRRYRRSRRVGDGVAVVDTSVSDVIGGEDAQARHASQHEGRPCDGHRARSRRLARHQLSDGPALARRVRDARAAGVRRASDRGHARRPRTRRILREGPAVALGADSGRDRRTQSGTAHSGHSGQRRRDSPRMSAVPGSRVLRRGRG